MPQKAPHICVCGSRVVSGETCACQRDRQAEYDRSRLSARSRGYDTRWDKARATFLKSNPTCTFQVNGETCGRAATIVDHVVPHRGDQKLFWNKGNWAALCVHCHSSRKQSVERRSYDAQRRSLPFDIRPARIPVTIVCGPAASGKSTYVRQRAGSNDLVIDLDEIRSRLSGRPLYDPAPAFTEAALEERNRLLRTLATDFEHDRCWFIVAAPNATERRAWQEKLGAEQVILLDVDADECRRRIQCDPLRQGQRPRMHGLVASWWQQFTRKAEVRQ